MGITKFLLINFTFGETIDKIKSARAVLVVYLSAKFENDIITEEYAENWQTSNFNNCDFCCFAVLFVVFMFYILITIYKGTVGEFLFYQLASHTSREDDKNKYRSLTHTCSDIIEQCIVGFQNGAVCAEYAVMSLVI